MIAIFLSSRFVVCIRARYRHARAPKDAQHAGLVRPLPPPLLPPSAALCRQAAELSRHACAPALSHELQFVGAQPYLRLFTQQAHQHDDALLGNHRNQSFQAGERPARYDDRLARLQGAQF